MGPDCCFVFVFKGGSITRQPRLAVAIISIIEDSTRRDRCQLRVWCLGNVRRKLLVFCETKGAAADAIWSTWFHRPYAMSHEFWDIWKKSVYVFNTSPRRDCGEKSLIHYDEIMICDVTNLRHCSRFAELCSVAVADSRWSWRIYLCKTTACVYECILALRNEPRMTCCLIEGYFQPVSSLINYWHFQRCHHAIHAKHAICGVINNLSKITVFYKDRSHIAILVVQAQNITSLHWNVHSIPITPNVDKSFLLIWTTMLYKEHEKIPLRTLPIFRASPWERVYGTSRQALKRRSQRSRASRRVWRVPLPLYYFHRPFQIILALI